MGITMVSWCVNIPIFYFSSAAFAAWGGHADGPRII